MATWPIQQVGSTGENVRSVQYLVNAHGANIAVDGIFGAATKGAVEQFQGAHNLVVDGIVGNQTWPALIIQVQAGSTGQAVEAVQSQVDFRVDILALDGIFGPKTDSVVRSFQAPCGLVADGIVGPNTWNAFVNQYLTASSGNHASHLVYKAWAQNNQASARKNATPQAVAQLFAQAWSPNTWTFAGCTGGAGSIFCTWSKAGGGQLMMRANNNVGVPFFYVAEVKFV